MDVRSPLWSIPIHELTREHVEGSLGPLLRRALGERAPFPGLGTAIHFRGDADRDFRLVQRGLVARCQVAG